jgi:hypothetical protein
MESASLTRFEVEKRVHALLPCELRFPNLQRALQTNAWAERSYFTASLVPFSHSNRLLFEAMQASALETANHCSWSLAHLDGSQAAIQELYRESQAFHGTWRTRA